MRGLFWLRRLLSTPVTWGTLLPVGSAVTTIATAWLSFLTWQTGLAANAFQVSQNAPLLAVTKVRLNSFRNAPELELIMKNTGGSPVTSFCLYTLGTLGDLHNSCSGDLGAFDILPGQGTIRRLQLGGIKLDGRPFKTRSASLGSIDQPPITCPGRRHIPLGIMTKFPDAAGNEHIQVRWVALCE